MLLSIVESLLLAASLCADCFAVSTCSSVTLEDISWRKILPIALAFGVVQTALMAMGWLFGDIFVGHIHKVASLIGFLLLLYVGGSMILEAVKKAGYEPGKDFKIAMDAASSEWKSEKGKGYYKLPKAGTEYTAEQLIEHWAALCEKYPIISIEDGLDEEDWEGWQKLTARLGDKVQLVGDDLFVTNTERLSKGISLGAGNAILIKLNQIGSVSETLEAIKMAHKAGYTAISSHRSGETADTTIADLAVALNTCQIKTGAPSRSERVAKYNQLLRIEEELGDSAVYPGIKAFNVH